MCHEIVRLQRSRRAEAAEILAWAFRYDPLFTALLPAPEVRQKVLVNTFAGVVGYAQHYGEVLTTPEVRGAACWLPPGRTEVTF